MAWFVTVPTTAFVEPVNVPLIVPTAGQASGGL
jgi:hypothetical protein